MALTTGCSGQESDHDFDFVNHGLIARTGGSTTVLGGTSAQRRLVRDLARRIDPTGIRLVRVHRPPDGYRPSARMEAYGNLWLTVHVRAVPGHDTIAAAWKASLLGGAFRDAARAASIGTLLGHSRVVEYRAFPGHRDRGGSLMTGSFEHDVRAASPAQAAAAIEKTFLAADESIGVQRVVVRFIRPIQLAATIDVWVQDTETALGRLPRLESDLLEGWLVRLRGPRGKVRAAWMASTRAGGGGSWGLRRTTDG